MFNKKEWNKVKLCVGMMLCTIAVLTAPSTTITSYATESGNATVYTDFRQWVYKIENGKMYKALFNNSTGLYETDWIYVCEWPPEE